jgi:hypothetical protein
MIFKVSRFDFFKFCALTVLFLSFLLQLPAQEIWDFPSPAINEDSYTITDTIYMAIDGNDANPGTYNEPVESFAKAISLLPFGEAGVNDGQAYGLIMLHPGIYVVENGFQQNVSQYEKDGTYKNVSVEGIGEVTIQGMKESPEVLANGHGVHLRGSHIYIKNLKIKFVKLHGILLGGPDKMTDVLVENIEVDSAGEFSFLATNVENVIVRDSRFLRGSRIFKDDLVTGPDCSWPSGLKFYGSKYVQSINNEVAYTRGEGLNFHNSEYGLAINNRLHDNPTNIYCDNSARIIIRNNYNYATPGNSEYWKTCPSDDIDLYGSTGILLANEGACNNGGPIYGNCTTTCPFDNLEFKQIDSIFIFNNFFVNTTAAINMWQGVTEPFGGPNCLRNIFFEHNTVIGITDGSSSGQPRAIYAFFPNFHNTIAGFGYATAQNININSNIISLPFEDYQNADLYHVILHNIFPVPFNINFKNNLVNMDDPKLSSSDKIVSSLINKVDVDIDSVLQLLQPCIDQLDLEYKVEVTPYIAHDFSGNVRNSSMTNAGALEYTEACNTISSTFEEMGEDHVFRIFPNPTKGLVYIETTNQKPLRTEIQLINVHGKVVLRDLKDEQITKKAIDLNQFEAGLYFIQFRYNSKIQTEKIILL